MVSVSQLFVNALLSAILVLVLFVGLYYTDKWSWTRKHKYTINVNALFVFIIYLVTILVYLLGLLIPVMMLSLPFMYTIYISITLYIIFIKYIDGFLESIGLTFSLLVVLSLLLHAADSNIVDYIVNPFFIFALFTLLLILSIRVLVSNKEIDIQLSIHTIVLFIILLVIVMFMSYMSSLVEVYTPYSDYPRHFRFVTEIYYNPSKYEKTLYMGYHSLVSFLLRASSMKPDINHMYYMLMFFDITLLIMIYEYFKHTIKKPWFSIYVWLFAGNISVILLMVAIIWDPISGMYRLFSNTSFRNYMLFKLVDPEVLGLFMFILLMYGIERRNKSITSIIKRTLLLLSLTTVYVPHVLLYAVLMGASVKRKHELLEHTYLFIIVGVLSALLSNRFGLVLLVVMGASIMLILSYLMTKLLKMLWRKFQHIITGNVKFIAFTMSLSIVFYAIFLILIYNNDLLRLSYIVLRFTTLFDIPWYLGLNVFLVLYVVYSLPKLSLNDRRVVGLQLRYLCALIFFMIVLSMIDFLILYNYDVFKIATEIKSIYWAYRIVPYLYLFMSPIVVVGLHRIRTLSKNDRKQLRVSRYVIAMLLVIIQVFGTSFTASYSHIQTYEKGYLSETEYQVIEYLLGEYVEDPRNSSMCVFAFSTRDRLILQYVPSNNNVLNMFYNQILLSETNRYVIVSTLLSMSCIKYYFVVGTIIEEKRYVPETITLVSDYYDNYTRIGTHSIYEITRDRLENLPHRKIDLRGNVLFIIHALKVNGNISIINGNATYNLSCNDFIISRNNSKAYFICDNKNVVAYSDGLVKVVAKGKINTKELILGCEPRELCELFSLISIRPLEFSGDISFSSMLYGYWILGKGLIVHGLYEKIFDKGLNPIVFSIILYVVLLLLSVILTYYIRNRRKV